MLLQGLPLEVFAFTLEYLENPWPKPIVQLYFNAYHIYLRFPRCCLWGIFTTQMSGTPLISP